MIRRRLCISAPAEGRNLFVAGLDGLWEGGAPTVMARSKEEVVGKLVRENPTSFDLEEGHKLLQGSDVEIGSRVLANPEDFNVYLDE